MNSKPPMLRDNINYIPAEDTDIRKTWAKHGWVAPTKAVKVVAEHESIHTLVQYIESIKKGDAK